MQDSSPSLGLSITQMLPVGLPNCVNSLTLERGDRISYFRLSSIGFSFSILLNFATLPIQYVMPKKIQVFCSNPTVRRIIFNGMPSYCGSFCIYKQNYFPLQEMGGDQSLTPKHLNTALLKIIGKLCWDHNKNRTIE